MKTGTRHQTNCGLPVTVIGGTSDPVYPVLVIDETGKLHKYTEDGKYVANGTHKMDIKVEHAK
jgi:hypothetical protein